MVLKQRVSHRGVDLRQAVPADFRRVDTSDSALDSENGMTHWGTEYQPITFSHNAQ